MVFGWLTGRTEGLDSEDFPAFIQGFEAAQRATTGREWVQIIHDYPNLPWEALPTQALAEASVWEALLPTLPLTATIRNLGRLTRLGVINPMSQGAKEVVAKLHGDVKKARVHPLNVLTALFTYRQGHGVKGGDSWSPIPQITSALEDAFYASFGNVVPAGKRTLISIDVSASMTWSSSQVRNLPLSCREAAAALAMVVVRTESEYLVTGFCGDLQIMPISDKSSLAEAIGVAGGMRPGTTDCAQPMIWAKANKLAVDTFIVLTDNETHAGRIHPHQALEQYRQASGIPAREVVVGMVSTKFSIADPKDPGALDVIGFDTSTPDIISTFSRGDI
jgi:60 kDa SS-A/Ro ribonucleoprotein